MITVHHLDNSRSFRVVWLLEELQLPYDLVCHRREADMRGPDALRAVHPLAKAPIICDDKTLVFESGAILEYIIHRYGHGRLSVPAHHMDYAPYLTWLHAAEGTALPAARPLIMGIMRGTPVTEADRNANEAVLRLCDDALAHRPWFGCTEFTAADIMMHTYVSLCTRFASEAFARYERLPRFLKAAEARAGFMRAKNIVGPGGEA